MLRMNKTFSTQKRLPYKTCRTAFRVLPITALVLGVSMTSALSFNGAMNIKNSVSTQSHFTNVSHETSQKNYNILSSSTADTCLSLLKMQHITPSFSTVDRNRRSAGAMALGALLGVRLALDTQNAQPTAKLAFTQHNSGHIGGSVTSSHSNAASVAAYRECRKMRALDLRKAIEAEAGA